MSLLALLQSTHANEAFVKGNIVYEIKLPDGKKVYTAYVEIEAENKNDKTVFHIE